MTDTSEGSALAHSDRCGHHGPKVGATQYICHLLRGHKGEHADSFTYWNDAGQCIEQPSKETKEAEANALKADTTGKPWKGDGAIVRTSPGSIRRTKQAGTTAETQGPLQGVPVTLRLREITAFDKDNMRNVALVELARSFVAKGIKPTDPRAHDLMEEISDLYESIRAVGLLEPLIVWREGDAYILKAGSRRMAVLLMVYGEDTQIVALSRHGAGSRLAHMAENLARKDVPWHLVAQSFYEATRPKDDDESTSTDENNDAEKKDGEAEENKVYTAKELADATGYSISQVNNLIRVRAKLHPSIWKVIMRWAGTSKQQSLEKMLKLCALPLDEQVDTWRAMTEEKQKGNELPTAKPPEALPVIDLATLSDGNPSQPTRRMYDNEIQQLLTLVRGALTFVKSQGRVFTGTEAQLLEGALAVLEAITGQESPEVNHLRLCLVRVRNVQQVKNETPAQNAAEPAAPAKVQTVARCEATTKDGRRTLRCDQPKNHSGAHYKGEFKWSNTPTKATPQKTPAKRAGRGK